MKAEEAVGGNRQPVEMEVVIIAADCGEALEGRSLEASSWAPIAEAPSLTVRPLGAD